MSEKSHKLVPALVPGPLQGRSVYNELRRTKRRKQWEALRHAVLEAAANTCKHCEAVYESRMVCDEVWAYDDLNRVATLHGPLRSSAAIVTQFCTSDTHLMKVNGITKLQATKLIDDAFGVWMGRSTGKTWAIQIAPEIIEKHSALSDLKL